ncbi:MAG: filamentous hemagglutinin N-terminal domain-containing protein, partial [Terrimicrobiaceae bacterium]
MIRQTVLPLLTILALGTAALAGDVLRGGATADPARRNAAARASSGAEAAAQRAKIAQDRLARTTQVINALRTAQQRAASAGVVPNGLVPGGLQVGTGANARWIGAQAPNQSGNTVTVKQTAAQALLNWETFNIGRETTLIFDQSTGGRDIGKWIVFNHVLDPSGVPSRILGQIRAGGQVYVLNQNGIIFDGTSQVNTRSLVASSLPINENLVTRGLLNQNQSNAEFLFSNTSQNGFSPPPPLTPGGIIGDVVVRAGARLTASVSDEGSGGRVALIGPNVYQGGTISTPNGQTIIAAGLQVGWAAHNANDPSLRGLDTFVGSVGSYGGTARNTGIINIPVGSLTITGKTIEQLGAVDSLTTVTLNGRIDLLANYDSLPSRDFDPRVSGGSAPFLPRTTGHIHLGPNSVMRILPDLASDATTVGTTLPLRSQINLQARTVHFGQGAMLLAPNATVGIRAGNWGPVNLSNGADGTPRAVRSSETFVYTAGQIYLDAGAVLDVSGSSNIFVPLSQSILEVQLRGNELSVSPLQRTAAIRGVNLLIDIRRNGTFFGRQWIGTPLGDAAGFADIIQRTAGQLTTQGGSIMMQAGQAIIANQGAVLDVSGGFSQHEAGRVQTTRLLYQGRYIINIADATPDRLYDGIFTAQATQTSAKWSVSRTWNIPLAPLGTYNDPGHVAGAGGGQLSITAPGLVLDGDMMGQTVVGPRQLRTNASLSELPETASLTLRFEGQQPLTPGSTNFFLTSPAPPSIVFGPESRAFGVPAFRIDALQPIPASRLATFNIPASFFEQTGFGSLEILNDDGEFFVPAGRAITLPAGTILSSTGHNIDIRSSLIAHGGELRFVAYNLSPYQTPIDRALNPQLPQPQINSALGSVTLAPGVRLDVSGLVVDDRHTASRIQTPQGFQIDAGAISLTGYNVSVPKTSVLDASGGLGVNVFGEYTYGNAGSITVGAGNDLNYPSVLGGKLELEGQLLGYAGRGANGGTLSIKAPLIQVGGSPLSADTLLLRPDFFNTGGFQNFVLTGIGARGRASGADSEAPTPMIPAVYIAPGVVIEPRVESLAYTPFPGRGREAGLRRIIRPLGDRPPVSISLLSSAIRNDFFDPAALEPAGRLLVVRGDILLSERAKIITEPGGDLTLQGSTVTVLGELTAPGGTITLAGAGSFPQNSFNQELATNAFTTVHIGPRARISAAGTAAYYPDPFGRRVGEVFDGGSILISGNIVAEAGAIFDVSGASGVFDFHPSRFAIGMETRVPQNSGLNSMPYALRTIPFQVDSNGGLISLAGSQMLYSDATLLGRAGGETALGGTLSVSSGRFYEANSARSTADINMIVTQGGVALNGPGRLGIGRPVRDSGGTIRPGDGYFAANIFLEGGFDSLDLNFYYDENAALVAQAGNIRFDGNVNITARGFLRVAGGGVLQGDGLVRLAAPYVAVGQEFRPPLNPGDVFVPYRRFDVATGQTVQDFVTPTFGAGELSISASLLDVGTVVLKNFGSATLAARGGDIRGSGSFNIAGNLNLEAAQIYPVTLSRFSIFAYDSAGGPGTITIRRSGNAQAPLSAGGTLRLYASEIDQGGVLLAPFGSIVLGWDGTDDDLSTAGLNQPTNSVVGTALPIPVAQDVILRGNSITSVAGIDFGSNTPLLVPYGLSPDGVSVFDPSGVNFTARGLLEKRIVVAGNNVVTEGGSVIDLRGGGELFSYRWIQGTGGPVDLLGTASQQWSSAANYQTGDLVLFNGVTYSARIGISPSAFAFNQGPTPGVNRYWTEVAESYAIVPGFNSNFAPYAPFNTGIRAASLGGDPGYVSNSLRLGDRIFLDGGSGLPEGNYTLLPRRYALLPGAYLVTPQNTGPYGVYNVPEGSTFLTGFRFNSLNSPRSQSALRSRFEVAPPDVVAGRAQYETYNISDFLKQAAIDLDLDQVQRLPEDSGYLLLSGNAAMSLAGRVLSTPLGSGRGSMIDIASFADITITDDGTAGFGTVALNAGILSSYGAESLVIGGIRRAGTSGTFLEVRTQNILVDNPNSPLQGSDITLVARTTLELAAGSIIQAGRGGGGEDYSIEGDGVAIRVSGSENARINRTGISNSPTPLLTIGAGSLLSGSGVTLDSSYGFALDPTALVNGQALTFGAGQIGILLDGLVPLTGQIDLTRPQLAIGENVLAQIAVANSLSLIAYQNTIDLYGPGILGNEGLMLLSLQAGEIRGFNQGVGTSTLTAAEIEISNPRNIASSGIVSPPSGSLVLNSQLTRIGTGENRITGYTDVIINASGGLVFSGVGALRAQENIVANSPLITTDQGANQNLIAGGSLQLNKTAGPATVTGGFGGILNLQGTSVVALTDILLPGGLIDVRAIG